MNEEQARPWANALKVGYRDSETLVLASDTDEQLLLFVPFNQMVKLQGLVVSAPATGNAPKTVKLFANRPSMGFDEASSEAATQTIELTPEELAKGEVIPLKLVKFQNVRSLTIFFEDNQDDEESTHVAKISILGSGYGKAARPPRGRA